MEDHIKKKIQDIVNLYGNTILLREGYFENVFRAVIEKSDGHIITLKNKGGGGGRRLFKEIPSYCM